MEEVNQSTTGNQEEIGTTPNPPADLSATNGNGQPETESAPDAEKDELEPPATDPETLSTGEPSADLAQAPSPTPVEEEKINPLKDLHDTFHSVKGSMNASHQSLLGAKISNVISFFEGHYADQWKEKVESADAKVKEAEQKVEDYKNNAEQADKRNEFYETQLAEAKSEIERLQEEITRLKTPSVSPAPENANPDAGKEG